MYCFPGDVLHEKVSNAYVMRHADVNASLCAAAWQAYEKERCSEKNFGISEHFSAKFAKVVCRLVYREVRKLPHKSSNTNPS